jgi:uncharacterized phage-associated protein
MNSAAAAVNWFIKKNRTDRVDLTHLKIQKLLFFAQGWHLVHRGASLFEENIQAWKHGPVVEAVYHALQRLGKHEVITEPIPGRAFTNGVYATETSPELSFQSDQSENFTESFWEDYSKIEPWVLVSATHAEGSPWRRVVSSPGYDHYANSLIPRELMRSYFASLLLSDG